MKSTKAKSSRKSMPAYEVGVETAEEKISAGKFYPSEQEIREKALEIYLERISGGLNGNAETDWFEAIEYLKSLK
jgi:hypothetical protein